jgi:hypothetical protein
LLLPHNLTFNDGSLALTWLINTNTIAYVKPPCNRITIVLKKDEALLTNDSCLELRFMLLVKSIIDYAHGAGKKVILEGVETTVDLQLAKQLQVDYVQGFYFKKQFKQVG